MRIIYNYIFDVTKVLNRGDMMKSVADFIKNNDLSYNDVLFQLSTYKQSQSKRKTYFDKLCDKDLFWSKYKVEYTCKVAKETDVIGVSNLHEGNWIKKEIQKMDENVIIVDKLNEQMNEMPQYTYNIVFNDVSWAGRKIDKRPIIVSEVAGVFPLSNNINLMNTYENKNYVVLCFEMCSEQVDYKKYVEKFSNIMGIKYKKEIQFVKEDNEKKIYFESRKQVDKLLENIKKTEILVSNVEYHGTKKIHIKKILREIFYIMNLQSVCNGVYELYMIDQFRNKLILFFDYDKEKHSLSATLTYRGIGFKYNIMYSEIKNVFCDELIRQYAKNVLYQVNIFIEQYVPQIVKYYKETPEWYEWD